MPAGRTNLDSLGSPGNHVPVETIALTDSLDNYVPVVAGAVATIALTTSADRVPGAGVGGHGNQLQATASAAIANNRGGSGSGSDSGGGGGGGGAVVTPAGGEENTLASFREYVALLRDLFALIALNPRRTP